MSLVDFTTWAETDPGNDITINGPQTITITNLPNNVIAHVDSPAIYNYNGDFELIIDAKASGPGITVLYSPALMCDTNNSRSGLISANKSFFNFFIQNASGAMRITLEEVDSGIKYTDTFIPWVVNTIYTFVFSRDISVGPYGTLYCDIWTGGVGGVLIDTLAITLHTSLKIFDRLQAATSNQGGGISTIDGVISKFDDGLELAEKVPPHLFQGVI